MKWLHGEKEKKALLITTEPGGRVGLLEGTEKAGVGEHGRKSEKFILG